MKKTITGFILAVTVALSGCSIGTSVENQLSDAITELNNTEKDYREAQSTLFDLEKAEQKLFNETMELTHEQHEEMTTKVAELDELLAQRVTLLEKEESSMQKAKALADELNTVIENADENNKKMIEELKSAIDHRYELHATFISEYRELTTLQKTLYGMLVAEDTKMAGLKEQVEEVNAKNEKVQSAVLSFNEATKKVNTLKDEISISLQEGK